MPVARKAVAFIGPSTPTGPTLPNGAALTTLAPGGLGTDPARVPAPGWGTFGWVRVLHSAPTGGGFLVNGLVTGGTSGAKGRIVQLGTGFSVMERVLVSPEFTIGETLTQDKNGSTAIVGDGKESSTIDASGVMVQTNTQLPDELMTPWVNATYPSDASANLWWEPGAKLAAALPVASVALWAGQIRRIQNAPSAPTATALVVGTIGGGSLAVADVTGTWTNGASVYPFGGGSLLTTVNGNFTDTVAGEITPYSFRPALGGLASKWDLLPFGSDSCGRVGAIGLEPQFIRKAFTEWGAASFFIKHDSNAFLGTNGIGGLVYARINCTGTFPGTWVLGETLSGTGGWTGKLVAYDVANKFLYVTRSRGVLSVGGTVSGAVASTTALDVPLSFQKNCKFWSTWLAEITKALAKASGDTFDWRAVVNATWLGDILVPGISATSLGMDFQDCISEITQWLQDVRSQLGAAGLIVPAIVHKTTCGNDISPNHSAILRLAYQQVARLDSAFRPVYGDEFASMVLATGYQAENLNSLFFEPIALPFLGRKAWDTFKGAILDAIQSDLDDCALVFGTGQSQLAGSNSYLMGILDDDPELWKMGGIAQGEPGLGSAHISTLDDRIKIYNAQVGAWQTMSIFSNCSSFGNQFANTWGLNVLLAQRLLSRLGRIYLIWCPFLTSSMQAAARGQAGTWDDITRLSVATSVTVQLVTVTGLAASRYVASSGTPFAAYQVGENCEVRNARLAANNTPPDTANNPRRILAVNGGGASIDLEGSGGVVDATPTVTTLVMGPVDLKRIAAQVVRDALTRLVTQEGRIPRRVLGVTWQGEGDLDFSTTYQAALERHIDWKRQIFGHRVGNELECPEVVIMLSDKTPLGTDQEVANIRNAQLAVGSSRPRVSVVETKDLPQRTEQGVWPRSTRVDNGVHFTMLADVTVAGRVDSKLDAWSDLFPPHPPDASFATGAADGAGESLVGGGGGDTPQAPTAEETVGGGGVDPVSGGTSATTADSLVDAVEGAMADGLDVASYIVNGRSVTMRSLRELIELHKYMQAEARRANGIRRTRVRFG
jgi:hypothetical protein